MFETVNSHVSEILAGLGGAVALRAFYAAISSEWPRHYFMAKTSLESHSRANFIRYLALRTLPVFIFGTLVAIVTVNVDGKPLHAVITMILVHLWTSTLKALRNLWRHDRQGISAIVIAYHVGSIATVALAGFLALATHTYLKGLVPSGRDALNAVWTAALAAILAAGLKRAMDFDRSQGVDRLERAKTDIGAQAWAYCEEAAVEHRTDPELLRAIILSEALQRPRWVRRLENAAGKVLGPGTYGVAQMHANSPIDDLESIQLLAKSFQDFRPVVSSGEIQRLRTKAALERHNSSEAFLAPALDFFEELILHPQWSTTAIAWDGRPCIEVVDISRDGDQFLVRGTASAQEGVIQSRLDDKPFELITVAPRAPGRGKFTFSVGLDTRNLLFVEPGHADGGGKKARDHRVKVSFIDS